MGSKVRAFKSRRPDVWMIEGSQAITRCGPFLFLMPMDPTAIVRSMELIRRGPSAIPQSSRTHVNDCLPRASLGRVEGSDRIVQGRDVADVRAHSPVTHPPDDLAQLGTIGLDHEV